MDHQSRTTWPRRARIADPGLVQALTGDVRWSGIWLIPRVIVGWHWCNAGWQALQPANGAYRPSDLASLGAVTETLAGIALMLGILTGVAAFVGGCIQFGGAFAESGAMNIVAFTAVISSVLAWKTAGWIGFDRWLLPLLVAPWQARRVEIGNAERSAPEAWRGSWPSKR